MLAPRWVRGDAGDLQGVDTGVGHRGVTSGAELRAGRLSLTTQTQTGMLRRIVTWVVEVMGMTDT
jgi:hypothetical protein